MGKMDDKKKSVELEEAQRSGMEKYKQSFDIEQKGITSALMAKFS